MMSQEIIPYSTEAMTPAISEAQHTVLTQQTPEDAILTRRGKGGRTFSYVPHAWVTEVLNNAFGWAWSWEVVEWRLVPENGEPREVFVLGRLTVHGQRDLTKTQFGSSAVKRDKSGDILSIGDDLKAASSDALKKCASLLGVALDLYKAEGVRPSDSDGGAISSDPMTAYWAAVKAKGIAKEEGQAHLQKHDGDPNRALKGLTELPQEKTQENGNGWPARPWDPETVKRVIQAVAARWDNSDETPPGEEDPRATIVCLSKISLNDDNRRYALTEFLTDGKKRSSKDLTPGEKRGIRRWVGATRENGWEPNNNAITEAEAIYRHLGIGILGQDEIPF